MKILIAEDDAVSRRLLEAALVKWGYTVAVTRDGNEAWNALQGDEPPRIAILDWMMPGLDGVDVCRKVREIIREPYIYLILLTSLQREEDLVAGLESGADDYITKPFKPNELRARLRSAMRIIESKKELEAAYRDLASAQSRILQQEKMASIGQLAAGVAHEINNPIGFIISNLGTFRKYLDRLSAHAAEQTRAVRELSEGRENGNIVLQRLEENRRDLKIDHITSDSYSLIDECLDGAVRVKTIVQDLKSFSHVDEVQFQRADINECLQSTINIVWNELKYKAVLHKEFGEVPLIHCNPGQLNQVFVNLLMNAAHAIEVRGDIFVRTWSENGAVHISIRDTGCGISPDNLRKIFEPFFTTKEVGQGTGLGLSIAYDIVKKHNGSITVDSAPGAGAAFTVTLPIPEEQ